MRIGMIGLGKMGGNSYYRDDIRHAARLAEKGIDASVPTGVLTAALYARFRSRQEHTFAEKMLSAMRCKFGGHVGQPAVEGK